MTIKSSGGDVSIWQLERESIGSPPVWEFETYGVGVIRLWMDITERTEEDEDKGMVKDEFSGIKNNGEVEFQK